MLHNGNPVDLALMTEIANRLHIPVEPLLPFLGKPLRSLYQEAICGGIVFEVTGGRSPVRVEVPMAFQSAMAGIMLAGEMVKRPDSRSHTAWTTAKLNLLRKMSSDVITERRRKSWRCAASVRIPTTLRCTEPSMVRYKAQVGHRTSRRAKKRGWRGRSSLS
ncbi:MAG: hypothetical protein EOQ46_26235 [Mesorhizobium sp.]|uniref:hypothetical protein n=1 Tax=Mesorhizobium sp. TaxID=1871066 RepID=UPI000FE64BE3|nr:hypothetical protein [Mesorhizobium sp.]RWB39738.1 MAG: hypothetical protein EOQ46_26235 [Mesorhizobium sp.]